VARGSTKYRDYYVIAAEDLLWLLTWRAVADPVVLLLLVPRIKKLVLGASGWGIEWLATLEKRRMRRRVREPSD